MILEERIIGPQLYNSHKQELGASCEDEELIVISNCLATVNLSYN